MRNKLDRRDFILSSGTALAASALTATTVLAAEPGTAKKPVKILGIACSHRKGMTTSKAVQIALDAAKGVDARIEVELIDLGGLIFAGWSQKPPEDDFTTILPKLQDPAVGGLIIGSPAYYRAPSSLCKAFIERCAPLREPKMLMADKPIGVVAVGAFRNGGQELVIEQVQTAMLCFGMIPVGGKPPAFQGATVLSTKDDISGDDLGLDTAKKLGIHVAEMALKLGA
ncbi:MAG: flavodoxin family protein [Kiritimatiellae bacterium]|nr:flavodoxin family protein [Kiritimatiellia bacterium]MDD5519544.1 flavodoxin family protein [Kiritimatiellia bacterium]